MGRREIDARGGDAVVYYDSRLLARRLLLRATLRDCRLRGEHGEIARDFAR